MLLEITELHEILKTDEAEVVTDEKPVQKDSTKYIPMVINFSIAIVLSLYVGINQTLIVPFIMGVDSSSLTSNIVITSGELVGALLMFVFIQNKKRLEEKELSLLLTSC